MTSVVSRMKTQDFKDRLFDSYCITAAVFEGVRADGDANLLFLSSVWIPAFG